MFVCLFVRALIGKLNMFVYNFTVMPERLHRLTKLQVIHPEQIQTTEWKAETYFSTFYMNFYLIGK